MSYITIGQAAKLLGISKRTLMRWDEAGKFSPTTREQVTKSRLYDEYQVKNLRILLNHEKRYRENMRRLRKVMSALNLYQGVFLLGKEEGKLLEEEIKLTEEHRKLIKEFEGFKPAIKQLYKQLFIGEK